MHILRDLFRSRPQVPAPLDNGMISQAIWTEQQSNLDKILDTYKWEVTSPRERPSFSIYLCTLNPWKIEVHYSTLGGGLIYFLPDGSSTNDLNLAVQKRSIVTFEPEDF